MLSFFPSKENHVHLHLELGVVLPLQQPDFRHGGVIHGVQPLEDAPAVPRERRPRQWRTQRRGLGRKGGQAQGLGLRRLLRHLVPTLPQCRPRLRDPVDVLPRRRVRQGRVR